MRTHISGSDTNTFSADQIIDKTLIAKKKVQLKRIPSDSEKTVFTVQPGGTVGRVYSWTGGGGTSPLWWMFYDENGKTYYAKHEPGLFDIKVLKDQGGITVKEETEKKEKEESGSIIPDIKIPNPFEDMSGLKMAGYAIGAVALIGLAASMWPRPRYGVVRVRGLRKQRKTRRRR